MKAWLDALRFRTLPLSVSGVVVAAGLAAQFSAFRISVFLPMLLMVLLLQTLANFADEYGDLEKGADNAERIGPIRGMQRGDITRRQMKGALVVTSLLAFAAMLALLFASFHNAFDAAAALVFVALGVLCIAAAIAYTVGRFAYGYKGMGDLVTFITFGPLAVVGGFYLYTHEVVASTALVGVGLGLLVVGVLNLNNMRDLDNDKECGKRTVAVVLGKRASRAYHAALLGLGVALFLSYPIACKVNAPLRYAFIVFAAFVLVQLVKAMQVSDPRDFDSCMKPLSIATVLLSLSFALCMGL